MNIRESILLAGVALLREQGIAALTQPRVAKAAAIKQSHLTYYFPTRTDLLLGIAEEAIRITMANLAARIDAAPQEATLAVNLAEALIAGIPPRIIIGLVVAADADPEVRKPLRRLIKQVRRHIQALLARAGLPADAKSALLFHATVVGLAIMHQARVNTESKREAREGIAAMLQLLTPAGAASGKGVSR